MFIFNTVIFSSTNSILKIDENQLDNYVFVMKRHQ